MNTDRIAESIEFFRSLAVCTPAEAVARCERRAREYDALAREYAAEGATRVADLCAGIAQRSRELALALGTTPETHPDLWGPNDPDAELAAMTGEGS